MRGEDVQQIAALCRLHLRPDEVEKMRQDLERILSHMDRLNHVDTGDLEALFWTGADGGLREDEPVPGLDHERALAAAPSRDDVYVRVRKIGAAL